MRPLGKLREDFISAVQNQRGTLLEAASALHFDDCPTCGSADIEFIRFIDPLEPRPDHHVRAFASGGQESHRPPIYKCNVCYDEFYLSGWTADGVELIALGAEVPDLRYTPMYVESAKLRKSLKEGEWTDEEEQSYRYKAQSVESGVVEWVTGWGFPAELGKAIAYEFDAGALPVSDVYALCMDIQDMMSSEGFDTYGDAARELLRRIGGSENIKGYIASMKSNYPNVPNLESRKSKRKGKAESKRPKTRSLKEGITNPSAVQHVRYTVSDMWGFPPELATAVIEHLSDGGLWQEPQSVIKALCADLDYRKNSGVVGTYEDAALDLLLDIGGEQNLVTYARSLPRDGDPWLPSDSESLDGVRVVAQGAFAQGLDDGVTYTLRRAADYNGQPSYNFVSTRGKVKARFEASKIIGWLNGCARGNYNGLKALL